jgi:hypothetical protein
MPQMRKLRARGIRAKKLPTLPSPLGYALGMISTRPCFSLVRVAQPHEDTRLRGVLPPPRDSGHDAQVTDSIAEKLTWSQNVVASDERRERTRHTASQSWPGDPSS